ncbi:MAG TPA: hypothetical protein VHX38_30085 [Pseudonocardiaceae bacterium]|nr:hypothetical protein [Pseudonocardiaceae bacterium]
MKSRRRLIASAMAACAVVGLTIAVAPDAGAASGPIFTVMNTSETPPDGVYFRRDPHTADAIRVTGFGVYKNERVQLQCWAWGDAVGPYNDTLWYYANNVTRPTVGGQANVGYLNAHYINDGKNANVVDAGVSECGTPPVPPPPVPYVTPCFYNMKASTLHLTFSYGGNHRYYGNAWQAAANWTNLNTGITIKPFTSGIATIQFKDVYIKGNGWYAQAQIPQTRDWEGPWERVPPHPHVPLFTIIEVNQYYMDGLNDFDRTYALTHEIGHALGLAHPDKFCGINDQSIMDAGDGHLSSKTFNTPRYYDKIELEELYGLPRG